MTDNAPNNTETKPKHAGGRPPAYKTEYCQAIIDFFDIEPYREVEVTIKSKNGNVITKDELRANPLPFLSRFAESIGVTHKCLLGWVHRYPEFSTAYARAKQLQKAMLVENGLQGLYNSHFAIFTAKNITDMRDVQEIKAEIGTVADLMAACGADPELPGADRPALPETIDAVNVHTMQVESNAHAEVNNEDERNDG